MADNIVIQVTDQVSNTVQTKFNAIATSARTASSAISQLQSQLNALNATNLTSALNSVNTSNAALAGSVGNLNSAISALSGSIASLTSQLSNMNSVTNNTTNNITNITQASHGLNASLINLAAGIQVFHEIERVVSGISDAFVSVVQWQAGLDRFNIGLKVVSGSAEGFAANNEFVRATVEKLGLDLNTTGTAFVRLAASTQGTVLQGQATQQIFQSVAEAAAVLHLSTTQVNNTFLALEQMASKGTVSMQELRRQLGNDIPAAMEIAAKAMNVTTSQLTEMVKKGEVVSDDFLPKFAIAMHEKYGGAIEDASNSAQASLGRMSTAWTDFTRTIADSGLGKAATKELSVFTDVLNSVTEAMQRAKQAGSGFWGQAAAANGQLLSVLNPGNMFGYHAQSIQGIQKQLIDKKSQLSNTNDFYESNQLKYDIGQLEQKLTKLQAAMPTPTDAAAGNLPAAQLQAIQNQNNQAAVNKFLNSGKHQTRAQQLQQALSEVDTEFATATAHLQKGSDLYNQALSAATLRKEQLQATYDKPGIKKEHSSQQNELSAQLQELQGNADARKQLLQTDLANLRELRNDEVLTEKQYIQQVGDAHNKELSDLKGIAQQQADLASGKDQLSVRQKFLGEVKKLGQEQVTNAQFVQTALSELTHKTTQDATKQLLSLTQAGTNRNRSNTNSLLGIGMSTQQQQELSAYQQIQQRADQARLALTQKATQLGTMDSPEYVKGLQAISAEEQKQLGEEKEYLSQRDALMADWKNGASAALNTFLDNSKNVAGQTQTLFTNAFNGLTDALTTFVTTGKLSFSSLVNTFVAGLVKMELQAAESQIFKSLFNYAGIGAGAGAGALAGFDVGGYTGNLGTKKIAGVVHGQEFVFDAESTRKIGVQNLMSMMKSAKGYEQGGYVGTMPIQTGSNAPVAQTNLNVQIINNASDQVAITTKQTTDSAGNPTLEVMASLLEGQLAGKITSGRGKLHDSIQSKFGLRSTPGR